MVGIERRKVLWGRMWIVLHKEGSEVGGVGEGGRWSRAWRACVVGRLGFM